MFILIEVFRRVGLLVVFYLLLMASELIKRLHLVGNARVICPTPDVNIAARRGKIRLQTVRIDANRYILT